jgi:hypothetical protein
VEKNEDDYDEQLKQSRLKLKKNPKRKLYYEEVDTSPQPGTSNQTDSPQEKIAKMDPEEVNRLLEYAYSGNQQCAEEIELLYPGMLSNPEQYIDMEVIENIDSDTEL